MAVAQMKALNKTSHNSLQAISPCRRPNNGLRSPARKTLGFILEQIDKKS
jgi:hypothetical protein